MCKKYFLLLLLFLLLLFSYGCYHFEEPISTEFIEAEFLISSSYYDDGGYTYVYTGQTVIPVYDSPDYEVVFLYDGDRYVVDDPIIYQDYGNHLGEYVTGVLKIEIYAGAEVKTLMSLEDILEE